MESKRPEVPAQSEVRGEQQASVRPAHNTERGVRTGEMVGGSVKRLQVTYIHRVDPGWDHPVKPMRDPGVNNPNRCETCRYALMRRTDDLPR
jgi:hypothetical protein